MDSSFQYKAKFRSFKIFFLSNGSLLLDPTLRTRRSFKVRIDRSSKNNYPMSVSIAKCLDSNLFLISVGSYNCFAIILSHLKISWKWYLAYMYFISATEQHESYVHTYIFVVCPLFSTASACNRRKNINSREQFKIN